MRWSERAGFAPSSLHLAQSLKTRRRQGAATWRRSKQHDHLRGRRPLLLRYGSKTVQLLRPTSLMKQTRSIAKTGSGQTTQRDVKTEAFFGQHRSYGSGGWVLTDAREQSRRGPHGWCGQIRVQQQQRRCGGRRQRTNHHTSWADGEKNGLFEPFIYENDDFTKTGSGQT